MLLAYIDEIGETGAFVSKDHARYRTSPAFGYAGFVIPESKARQFGGEFTHVKRTLFSSELAKTDNPGQWERKGADIFRPTTPDKYPHQIRGFTGLVTRLKALGGSLFYYADEKRTGTPKQVSVLPADRESAAMRETLNRLCSHAEHESDNLLVVIDQINEKTRAQRLPNMYGHILGRASERQEMKRILEPPMHVDSKLSSNIQFADWVAGALSRAIDYQLIQDTKFSWVPGQFENKLRGSFTHESKLHLFQRSISDFNHSDILKSYRPYYPPVTGHAIRDNNSAVMADMYQAAVRHQAADRRRSE